MLRTPETMRRAVVLLAAIGWPCRINAPEPLNPVESLAAHPGLPLLFAADATGLVRVFDVSVEGGLVPSRAPFVFVSDHPEDLVVSPDGTLLAVSSGLSGAR